LLAAEHRAARDRLAPAGGRCTYASRVLRADRRSRAGADRVCGADLACVGPKRKITDGARSVDRGLDHGASECGGSGSGS